jgi:predicted ABC-type transport system involved in lysophospholipase L1 biosynthesis ATPase subunit
MEKAQMKIALLAFLGGVLTLLIRDEPRHGATDAHTGRGVAQFFFSLDISRSV